MLFFSSYLTQSDRQTPHSLPVHVGICIIRMLSTCLCTFAPVCVFQCPAGQGLPPASRLTHGSAPDLRLQ